MAVMRQGNLWKNTKTWFFGGFTSNIRQSNPPPPEFGWNCGFYSCCIHIVDHWLFKRVELLMPFFSFRKNDHSIKVVYPSPINMNWMLHCCGGGRVVHLAACMGFFLHANDDLCICGLNTLLRARENLPIIEKIDYPSGLPTDRAHLYQTPLCPH